MGPSLQGLLDLQGSQDPRARLDPWARVPRVLPWADPCSGPSRVGGLGGRTLGLLRMVGMDLKCEGIVKISLNCVNETQETYQEDRSLCPAEVRIRDRNRSLVSSCLFLSALSILRVL